MLIVPLPHKVQELEVNGKRPFQQWLKKLKNAEASAAILARIRRIEIVGNFGSYRYLNDGVFELKFSINPGYRVYFGLQHGNIVLLLAGGDKSSQARDIKKAIELWKEYLASLTDL